MPSPNGDALAAKLAELAVGRGRDAAYFTAQADGLDWKAPPAYGVLLRLLAWVAEQGAAGVPGVCDEARRNCPVRPCRHVPASSMPATDGNRPVNARTGAAPAPEPSEGSESVNRAHRRDDDPKGEGLPPKPPGCVCGWMRPDGGTWRRVPEAGCAAHVAPAPDAALRAAGMADAERAIFEAIARRGVPPLVGGAAHRTYTNGMARALEIVRAARAALSPDATGGDA